MEDIVSLPNEITKYRDLCDFQIDYLKKSEGYQVIKRESMEIDRQIDTITGFLWSDLLLCSANGDVTIKLEIKDFNICNMDFYQDADKKAE
jgi:hypothetical protein